MSALSLRIAQVINTIDSEYRTPVLTAFKFCNGDYDSFVMELQALAWDYPDFDYQPMLEQINA